MQTKLLPIPQVLRDVVECFRLTQYTGSEELALNVCLNGLPGIVFQHHNGQSPVKNIVTPSGCREHPPTLYVYGQMTQPGVMHHQAGPFTTLQVVLKPHGLQSLLGLNASVMTNELVELSEFSAENLTMQLLDAQTEQAQIDVFTTFMLAKFKQVETRDKLVEASLRLIHHKNSCLAVSDLLDHLHISERQFERRFRQTVGLTPQFYIRVKRFNRAIHLMQTGRFTKLTDVAHALNFYDQSHFIRDMKAFSGITPKNLTRKMNTSTQNQTVYAYV